MEKQSFSWSGRKALVTGAGGFIGSHLVEELVQRGAAVRALVRYNSRGAIGWLDTLSNDVRRSIQILNGDLRDANTCLRTISGTELVFHLGAIISIPYSYVNPEEVASVNVIGTLNILNACREAGVGRLVHTSTSEVYGTAQYVPIDEAHPLKGQSPYSASKIGADKLVDSYNNSFGLPAVTIRPFNTYGPRQSARAVIPTIIVQLLSGTKLNLGSLAPTRDFTYVADTVEGMIRAAECEGAIGNTINLGTNNEISIGDLVALIAEVMGCEPQVVSEESRVRPPASEVGRLRSNNRLAYELMGWEPRTELREGLARTIEWLKSHRDLYARAQTEYVV